MYHVTVCWSHECLAANHNYTSISENSDLTHNFLDTYSLDFSILSYD